MSDYDTYLNKLYEVRAELKAQAECIRTQAEYERKQIDVYSNEERKKLEKELCERRNEFKKDINLKEKELYNEIETAKKELRDKEVELKNKENSLQEWKSLLEKTETNTKTKHEDMYDIILECRLAIFDKYEKLALNKGAFKSLEAIKNLKKETKEYLQRIKELECELRLHYYIFPILRDKGYLYPNKEETLAIEHNSEEYFTEEEKRDESHLWITPDEYRKLSSTERNQRALDNYKKKALSNWEIGKMYERYIGYQKEEEGFKVDYDGIQLRYEDRGRDLICERDDEIQIIQCKMWSVSKTIYENNIFQFFGTVYYAREEEKKKNPIAPRRVRGLFYTTTELSEYALKASQELGIEIIKEKMNKDYPCIKCNISSMGEKIYHLPFDQQYDNTKIERSKGEFYACTCEEAESKGFRRAMRYYYS